MRFSLVLVIFVLLSGCAVTPQAIWSPDGKSAVYQQNVMDPSGKTVDQLGPFDANAAWSADSATLYFTRKEIAGTAAAVTPLRRWVDGVDADKTVPPPQYLPEGYPRSTVFRRRDGKNEPLVTLFEAYVFSLAVSSDQKWLLIEAMNVNGSFDFVPRLLAYQTQSKKLYELADPAGEYCFTGANRVAYVGNDQIYETTMDESLPTLTWKPVLSVLPNSTSAVAGSEKGMLVLTSQASFPSPATQPVAQKIYAVGRDEKQFRELATAATGMMSLSPDGRRVLFIRSSDKGACGLAMMNVDGTHQRMLMDLTPFDSLPITPTWHGNDRITFASKTGIPLPKKKEEAGPSVAYDIVDYSIPPTGPMQPVQILSQDWSADQKPQLPLPGISRLLPATKP